MEIGSPQQEKIETSSHPYPPPCQDTLNSFIAMQERNYWGDKKEFSSQQNLEMFKRLGDTLAGYGLPFGAINGVRRLPAFLNFIVDDSGSMNSLTDLRYADAGLHMKHQLRAKYNSVSKLTRWEEAEDRLHLMVELMAYAPSKKISINFLNRHHPIVLDKENLSIDEFIQKAHEEITKAFKAAPSRHDLTPLYGALSTTFAQEQGKKTAHYLLTDGEPSDRSSDEVKQVIRSNVNQDCTLTIINCSDEELEWVNEIDEEKNSEGKSFVSTMDDFKAEFEQVAKKQGRRFVGEREGDLGLYSRAMWILCNLVSAVWPSLDNMDEPTPLKRSAVSALAGVTIPESSYRKYFTEHPNFRKYERDYAQYSAMASESAYPAPKGAEPRQSSEQTRVYPEPKPLSTQELIDMYYKLSVSQPLSLSAHANPAPQTQTSHAENSNTMFSTNGSAAKKKSKLIDDNSKHQDRGDATCRCS